MSFTDNNGNHCYLDKKDEILLIHSHAHTHTPRHTLTSLLSRLSHRQVDTIDESKPTHTPSIEAVTLQHTALLVIHLCVVAGSSVVLVVVMVM